MRHIKVERHQAARDFFLEEIIGELDFRIILLCIRMTMVFDTARCAAKLCTKENDCANEMNKVRLQIVASSLLLFTDMSFLPSGVR